MFVVTTETQKSGLFWLVLELPVVFLSFFLSFFAG